MIERHHLQNLVVMRRALYRHNQNCPLAATSFRMHPYDFERLGIQMLWGVPVVADAEVGLKRVLVECQGSAEGVECVLESWVASA